ncbi:MAG: hypothetical protein AAGA90_03325 [Actinomycetota bacterium]
MKQVDLELLGERVRLRPTTATDQDALVAIRSTPEVRRRWRGADLAAEFLADLAETDTDGAGSARAVTVRSTHRRSPGR